MFFRNTLIAHKKRVKSDFVRFEVLKEIISRTLKTLVNTGLQGFFDTSENMTENLRKELLKSLEDSKSVNNIQALADDILSITNQTNLLALNASIGQ